MRASILLPILLAGCVSKEPPGSASANPISPPPTTVAGTAATSAHPIFPPAPTVIGTATMLPDGTLVVSNPHMSTRVAPGDPMYAKWIEHIGGMKPGDEKSVPAWPDPFDPARVEAAARAHLAKKGVDPATCHGDIFGTDGEKNVSAWVECTGGARHSLKILHGSYEVVAPDAPKP